MTLYDCVPFFNELDILDLRLRELYDYVDAFVIVEATVTHKGDSKPLYFEENKARFADFLPKIRHIVVSDLPGGAGLPAIRRREMTQRNAILRGLWGARDDDMILISDADEIPRPSHLPRAIHDGMIAVYMQKLYYYNFNTHAPARVWPGTRACTVADARALSPHIIRNGMGQPDAHYPQYVALDGAGWHYSYFGDAEHIRHKQTQFLHQELVTPENTDLDAIRARVARGEDIWGRQNEQQFVIGPAADLPAAVLDAPERFAAFFAPGWAPVFHERWYDARQAQYVADLARQAPDGALVEIGAWEGKSTVAIAQAVAPRVLHVVDHWKGNPDEGEDHPATVAAAERDVWGDYTHNMAVLTGGNYHSHVRDWREWVRDWHEPIAFLHLDAAHDEASVRECLVAIKPFLVPGAILCGDDAYATPVLAGARAALGDSVEVVGERLWVWTKEK